MFIALVLSAPPAYSETFFRNKINILKQAGMKVVVFAAKERSKDENIEVVPGFDWDGSRMHRLLSLLVAIFGIVASPFRSVRLFRFNRMDGFDVRRNLLSLITSAHILRHSPDWIHFGFATTAIGRENLARVVGAKMAVSIRGYDIAVYPLKHPGCYELLWKRIDNLHYISDDLMDLARKQGLKSTVGLSKITPAVDTNFFSPAANDSLRTGPTRILSIGRLHWKKGFEYLLFALSLLRSKGIDFFCTIVGEGAELERLRFAVYQLNLTDCVGFVGKKSPAEIRNLLTLSDLYIQYSIQEGFCNAVLEAQAMGRLCIVSDAEGLAENVIHEHTGWVVQKRSHKLLAETIEMAIELSTMTKRRMGEAARTRVQEEFDLKSQRVKFLKLYGTGSINERSISD